MGMNMLMEMALAESENDALASESTSVTIADAVAIATANSKAEQLLQTPTAPPIKEYQSNVAATSTHGRNPGGGGEAHDQNPGGRGENGIVVPATPARGHAEESMTVGSRSSELYNSGGIDKSSVGNNAVNVDNYAWEAYFQGPSVRSSARITMAKSLTVVAGVLVGTLLGHV